MSKKRLPEKPFKVKFKVSRFGFTDFDVFVRRFAAAANWPIAGIHESAQSYTFENGWGVSLLTHGDINLFSPVLPREKAIEVYGIIDVLLRLDVRIGDNCEVSSQYANSGAATPVGTVQRIPVEFFCGSAVILFVITSAFQFFYRNNFSLPLFLVFESVAFFFAAIFGFSLGRFYDRNRDAFQESLTDLGMEKAHEEFMSDEDVKRKQKKPHELQPMDLVEEMRFPLENIMAYTRFYKGHTRPDSQHWKDLMEIVEQATRIREMMNRVESSFQSQYDDDSTGPVHQESHLFRKTRRILSLLSVTVRGSDLLGESFEYPCRTLNISETGACLLLPENSVIIGHYLELVFEKVTVNSTVRWVMQGKSGGMMFAGIEFAEPIELRMLTPTSEGLEPRPSDLAS